MLVENNNPIINILFETYYLKYFEHKKLKKKAFSFFIFLY